MRISHTSKAVGALVISALFIGGCSSGAASAPPSSAPAASAGAATAAPSASTAASSAPTAAASTSSTSSAPVITIANEPIAPFLPLWYLPKIAAQYGIQVKEINFPTANAATEAFNSGSVVAAQGGLEAAIIDKASGGDPVVVSGIATKGVGIVVKKSSNFTSLTQFEGQKFGTFHGIHVLLLEMLLAQNHIPYSTTAKAGSVQIVYFPNTPAANQAVENGQIPATTNAEPLPSIAVVQGWGKLLGGTGTPFGDIPYNTALGPPLRCVFLQASFVQKYPQATQKFVDALVAAIQAFANNTQAAQNFTFSGPVPGITPQIWKVMRNDLSFSPNLTVQDEANYVKYMNQYGMINKQVDPNTLLNLTFLQKAMNGQG